MSIVSVPIRVNGFLRPSRLVKSIRSYVMQSAQTIFRIFVIYRPAAFFGTLGAILFGTGVLTGLRFVYFWATGNGTGHVQSSSLHRSSSAPDSRRC